MQEKPRYVTALDGLRAFAVLSVIAYHMGAGFMPGGLLGVTMFFVLSGYLITGLLIAEFDKTGTISLSQFWLRRVRRIVPAVLTAIFGTLVLCTLFNHALLTKMRPDIIPTALFFNNWWQIFHNVSYFEALGAPSPLTHCWSLSIEEQFYLVWPVMLLLMFKFGVSRPTIRKVLVVLAAASALLMAIMFSPHVDPSRVYYGTDTRAFSLMIGAFLAFVWPYQNLTVESGREMDPTYRLLFNIVGVVAVVGLLLMCMLTNGFSPFIYRGGLVLCSLLTAVAIAVMVHPISWISRFFELAPLVWIGQRSYAMYLWHYPLILLMTPANMAAATPLWLRLLQLAVIFAVSAASLVLVENPIRHGAIGRFVAGLRDGSYTLTGWLQQRLAPVIAVAATGVVALCGVAFVPDTSALEGGDLLKNDEAQTSQTAEEVEGESESSGASIGKFDIVLIGDSVSVRAIPQFQEQFPLGFIDSQVNRQLYEAEGLYDYYNDLGYVGDVVVFALGTNGYVTDEETSELIEHIGSDKHIWFVNTRSTTDWMAEDNEALARAADKYPNVNLIDWYGYSTDQWSWFDGDGTHLSEEGADAYVQLIYANVKDYVPDRPAPQDSEESADESTDGEVTEEGAEGAETAEGESAAEAVTA